MFSRLISLSLFLTGTVAVSNAKTSLTLLYQNNLNQTDDINHVGFIVLDPHNRRDAPAACQAIGETLVPQSLIKAHKTDFLQPLSYHTYAGRAKDIQLYYVDNGVLEVAQKSGGLNIKQFPLHLTSLPVLCTQSSKESQPDTAVATASNRIQVKSSGNTYNGFRNQKSFRFLGIRYADKPERWTYPKQYSLTGQVLDATKYAPKCPQFGSGEEDCLFLNIQTPYIPLQGKKKDLRPVLFWIHGGGFVGGSNSDRDTDGGNLASREDIVTVTITYRLGTFGFLAVPGKLKGNFGVADQVTALEVRFNWLYRFLSHADSAKWTIKNIASFGGDPNQITIVGDSAGAASVRLMLGSPKTIGKFQGALALANPGGGVNLGRNGTYATAFSSYATIAESYEEFGKKLFVEKGCNQSTVDAQIACLRKVDALTLSTGTVAQKLVQDGVYINRKEINVVKKDGSTAHVPVIFAVTSNEGASIGSNYPKSPVTTELAGIQASLGISQSFAQSIIDSRLFPLYNTGNITFDSFNISQRVATDSDFRCVDQATAYAGGVSGVFKDSYFVEFTRSTGGYDPSGLGGPPVTPGYPNGNPNLPYFRLHSSVVPWVTGNLHVIRDAPDLWSVQLQVAYFGSYFRTGNPNPKESYLEVRGYSKPIEAIRKTGPWKSIQNKQGPTRRLDWPSVQSPFAEQDQCRFLNYPTSYYFEK